MPPATNNAELKLTPTVVIGLGGFERDRLVADSTIQFDVRRACHWGLPSWDRRVFSPA